MDRYKSEATQLSQLQNTSHHISNVRFILQTFKDFADWRHSAFFLI